MFRKCSQASSGACDLTESSAAEYHPQRDIACERHVAAPLGHAFRRMLADAIDGWHEWGSWCRKKKLGRRQE